MAHSAEKVSAEDARVIVAEHDARVIDIRDPEGFAEHRIPGSTNVPEPDPAAVSGDLGPDERILVVCERGERSAELAARLRDQGIEAASIEGGMEAWVSERMPTQPSPDPESEPEAPPKLPGAGV